MKYPVNPPTINQPFGANYNDSYAKSFLKGHSGIDFACNFGQPIYSSTDGIVFAVRDTTDPMEYRSVYVLTDEKFEVSYGHLKDISVKPGDTVKTGQQIGTAGNSGTVYQHGRLVTREEKLAGSVAGTHLHFQVREVKKVPRKKKGRTYLMRDLNSTYKSNGYYEVLNMDNGYQGGIDPMPFMDIIPTMGVTIVREPSSTKQTLGTLIATNAGATFSCKTLELADLNNLRNISCIPKGTYTCKYTFSPKFRKFTYEILKVPNRGGIRIHSANYFSDLLGCIALGSGLVDLNKDGQLDIINSRNTIKAFEGFMGKKTFQLTIK